MCSGTVNGIEVKNIMRDTGCNGIIVNSSVFPQVDFENSPRASMVDYLGRTNEFPVHRCYISCPWLNGWTKCVVAPLTNCTVLLGNAEGVSSVTTSCDQIQVGSDYVPPFEGTSSTAKVSESVGQNIPVHDKSLDIGDNSC